MGGYSVLDPTNYATTDDEDQDPIRRMLTAHVSPAPLQDLIPAAPPTPAPTGPRQVQRPGLAGRIVASMGDQRTGVSNPSQDPILTSSAPQLQPASVAMVQSAAQQLQPASTLMGNRTEVANGRTYSVPSQNPDPDSSLRPGGTNPEADPNRFRGVLSPGALQPASVVNGGAQLQPASGNAAQPSRHNALLRTLGIIGDVAGSTFAPNLTQYIPGSTLDKQRVASIQQQRAQAGALLADTQSQTELRRQEAAKNASLAGADQAIKLTPEQAAGVNHPELAGQAIGQRAYALMVQARQRQETGAGHDQARITTTGMNNDTSLANNQNTNQTRATVSAATNASHEGIAASRNKTAALLQNMRDSTSTANNERTNDTHLTAAGIRAAGGGANGQPGSFKVPPAVSTRAALGRNVQENAAAIQAIIQRNPDLIGKIGGSVSEVEQMIGSNNADLSELGVRLDNMIKASNGAHQLRGKYALEAGNKLLGNLRNGPEGFRGTLRGTTDSVQTFIDDEKNYRSTGSGVRPDRPANIPDGNIQVKLAGGRTGHIPAKNLDQFLKDNKGAAVVK